MKNVVFIFGLCLLACGEAWAQNNDCIKSRTVCGNSSFSNDNLSGFGDNDFANPANLDGCLNGESQSAWYKFTAQTSGTIEFTIDPNASDDYDFAVYGPDKTCDALGLPIRCNFSGGQGINTGLSSTIISPQYSPALPVLAGESYYLLINNFNNNSNGFSLSWGGTATLTNPSDSGNPNNIIGYTYNVGCNVVQFNNISGLCGAILSYAWNFGDGSPITSENAKPNPTHIYNTLGMYSVTLTTTVVSSPNATDVGLTATYTKTINVLEAPPIAQITNLQASYCANAPAVTLTGNIAGGTFAIKKNQTGNYLNNQTVFNPSALGVGKHEVKYTYINPASPLCVSTDIKLVDVFALPVLTLTSPASSNFCITSDAFVLTASPTDGIFKVNGSPATVFNPALLGAGNHEVKYEYTNPTTLCSNTTTKTITVHSPNSIVIDFPNLRDKYCVGSTPFTIQATPTGGILRINGITTQTFNPDALGVGVHTVSYTYTSPLTGCTNSKTKQVEVAPKPVLSFVGLKNSYCINEGIVPLQASPAGGVIRLNGTAVAQFNTTSLGAGNYTLTYQYTDATNNTCFNSIVRTFVIYALPTPSFIEVGESYCALDNTLIQPKVSIILANGNTVIETPSSLAFSPSQLPVGNHVLAYTATDANTGCQKNITKNITILPSPLPAFVGLKDAYCQQAFAVRLQASTTGGTFQVNGLPADSLKPRSFAVGELVKVSYSVTNNVGCSNTIEKDVLMLESPYTTQAEQFRTCPSLQTPFYIEALTPQEEETLKTQGITAGYYWDRTTDNKRVLELTNTGQGGKYEVWVRDADGCPLLFKKITVELACDVKLFVPTAFTPNGDALNADLQIFGEFIAKLDFRLYNRWGEIVFSTTNPKQTWNGTIHGLPAPAGVYVWQASYENELNRGAVFRQQGQVVLMR
ncbi:MAG: PKD domain-containing protein [Bacteroidetes bacterium]|nr:MAG: PKD domain-containing protein [Bacteroidota bacterium]